MSFAYCLVRSGDSRRKRRPRPPYWGLPLWCTHRSTALQVGRRLWCRGGTRRGEPLQTGHRRMGYGSSTVDLSGRGWVSNWGSRVFSLHSHRNALQQPQSDGGPGGLVGDSFLLYDRTAPLRCRLFGAGTGVQSEDGDPAGHGGLPVERSLHCCLHKCSKFKQRYFLPISFAIPLFLTEKNEIFSSSVIDIPSTELCSEHKTATNVSLFSHSRAFRLGASSCLHPSSTPIWQESASGRDISAGALSCLS